MKISFYKNSSDTIGAEVNDTAVLGGILSGRWKEQIDNLRVLLQNSEDGKEYDRSKRQLAAATFGGVFSERGMDNCIAPSGLLILDVDKLDESTLASYKEAFCADRYTYACFVSPSGAGLKILVKYDAANHLQAFLTAEKYYKETYACKLDPSGKDISRLCYVSCDPDMFMNEDSDTLIGDPAIVVSDGSNSFDKRPEKFKGYVISKDAREALAVCEKWTERHHQYVSGNRNNYIHVLACNLNRAGVVEQDALIMIYNKYSDLDFKEVETTVGSAYKNTSEHNSIDIYSRPVDELPVHREETETMSLEEETIFLDTLEMLKAGVKINMVSKYVKNYGVSFLSLDEDNVKGLMNQAYSTYKNESAAEDFQMSSAGKALMNVVQNYKDNGGVPTRVPEVDDTLNGGLMPGNLYGAIGDGGTFKSLLTMVIAVDQAYVKGNNGLVVYLNGEMSELQLMDRLLNKELGINLQEELRLKKVTEEKLNEYLGLLKEKVGENFQVVSSAGWNTATIAKKVKDLEDLTGKKATLIVVDGLTQMEDLRNDEIKSAIHNSGELKALAKDTNTAILCLVHVSGNPPKHHRDTSKLIRGGTKLINNMDAMFCTSLFIDEEKSNIQNNDIMYQDGMFYLRFIDKRGSGKIINKAIRMHRPLRMEVLNVDPQAMEVEV